MRNLVAALAGLALLCACANHGAGSAFVPGASEPTAAKRSSGPTTYALLTFVIPPPPSPAPPTFRLKPAGGYVSPATKNVSVQANGQTVLNTGVAPYTTRFSESFAVPAGTDTFVVTLSDQYQQPLSTATAKQAIASGKTTPLALTFKAVVESGRLVADNPYPTVGKPATIHVSFEAYDAAQEPINAGSYATAVKVRLKDPSHDMAVKGASQFDAAGQTVDVSYDGKRMTSLATLRTIGSSANQSLELIGNAYESHAFKGQIEGIAAGPSGKLLFSECDGESCSIGTIDAAGTVSRIGHARNIDQFVYAPDGAVWFTEGETAGYVGKMTMSGQVTHYRVPPKSGSGSYAIAVGPDGNVWFADMAGVAQISASGKITQHDAPIKSFPERSTYLVAAGKHLFFDDPPLVVCSAPVAGPAACFGFPDEQRTDNDVSLTAPLTPYQDRVFVGASPAFGASTSVDLLDDRGGLQRVASSRPVIVPAAAGDGRLFGLGSNGGSQAEGLAVGTFANGTLHYVTYPAPPGSVAFGGYNGARIVVVGGGAWVQGSNAIYRFSYAK